MRRKMHFMCKGTDISMLLKAAAVAVQIKVIGWERPWTSIFDQIMAKLLRINIKFGFSQASKSSRPV